MRYYYDFVIILQGGGYVAEKLNLEAPHPTYEECVLNRSLRVTISQGTFEGKVIRKIAGSQYILIIVAEN